MALPMALYRLPKEKMPRTWRARSNKDVGGIFIDGLSIGHVFARRTQKAACRQLFAPPKQAKRERERTKPPGSHTLEINGHCKPFCVYFSVYFLELILLPSSSQAAALGEAGNVEEGDVAGRLFSLRHVCEGFSKCWRYLKFLESLSIFFLP